MLRLTSVIEFFHIPINVYFTLWCLYILQGVLYPAGSFISQFLLLIILLISLRHTIIVYNWDRKPVFFRGLETLFLLHLLYGIILIISDGATTKGMAEGIPTYYYIKAYSMSLLPIMTCYYYTNKKILTPDLYRKWIPIFFIVAILQYYNLQQSVLAKRSIDVEGMTNNAGYYVLSLIPCMLIMKKELFQYIGIAICSLLIIMSMKRGAILIWVFVLLLFIVQRFNRLKGIRKFSFLLLLFIVGFIIYNYLSETLFQNAYFEGRVNQTLEGKTSGRDGILENLLSFYNNKASLFQQIFGIGADGTIKISPYYAHNDWVETLINQGALGVFVYIFYWACLIISVIHIKIIDLKHTLFLSFVVIFLESLFSMSITDYSIYTSSLIGFVMGIAFNNDIVLNSNVKHVQRFSLNKEKEL